MATRTTSSGKEPAGRTTGSRSAATGAGPAGSRSAESPGKRRSGASSSPATRSAPAERTRPEPVPATSDPALLAEAIRDAVLGVPGVARLSPGLGGAEVATQFAGGRIVGIRLGDPVEVHVEIEPVPIGPLAERIRLAARQALGRFGSTPAVEVVVDDLDLTPVPAGSGGN